MKYKTQACLCFTLRTMQTSLPTKTRLRQQTTGKEAYYEKFNEK